MPAYYYEAAYANGEKVSGVVEASSRGEAISQIRRTCDVVTSLREVRRTGREEKTLFRRVDAKALSLVCRQFSIVLRAGLPLVQAVDLTASQTQDKVLSRILHQVAEDVSNGWSLSYSFQQRGAKLPAAFIETVRAGEESGDLTGAFLRMSDYYERMHKTRSKTTSALVYPVFLMCVAVAVVAVIMLYAVPSFSNTFNYMGIDLPWVTRFLIGVSGFFSRHIVIIVFVLAVALIALKVWSSTEKGRERMARFRLKIPVLGRVEQMAGASQFAHTMSTMLSSGMPILRALDVSGRAIGNYAMQRAVLDTIPGVESGRTLGECMQRAKELPDMLTRMTAMGEATGSIEDTLSIIAEYYDGEVDTVTARALSLLEPIIIMMLAVVVVIVLMAVYLPMFSLYSAI